MILWKRGVVQVYQNYSHIEASESEPLEPLPPIRDYPLRKAVIVKAAGAAVQEKSATKKLGGYTPVATLAKAADSVPEPEETSNEYSDFMHFNYGAPSRRYQTPSSDREE
ncbi:hypothetical protein ACXYMU_18810 [Pontibacter sp. CAU 1760]